MQTEKFIWSVNQNYMTRIHNKELNKLSEYDLLHDMINPPKLAKNLDIHYSTILHVCMKTIKVKVKFKNFRILLGSGCSSAILMVSLVKTVHPEKYDVIQ